MPCRRPAGGACLGDQDIAVGSTWIQRGWSRPSANRATTVPGAATGLPRRPALGRRDVHHRDQRSLRSGSAGLGPVPAATASAPRHRTLTGDAASGNRSRTQGSGRVAHGLLAHRAFAATRLRVKGVSGLASLGSLHPPSAFLTRSPRRFRLSGDGNADARMDGELADAHVDACAAHHGFPRSRKCGDRRPPPSSRDSSRRSGLPCRRCARA